MILKEAIEVMVDLVKQTIVTNNYNDKTLRCDLRIKIPRTHEKNKPPTND